MKDTSYASSRGNSRRRHTALDYFGVITMIVLLAVSAVLYFRLNASGLLDRRYLNLILIGLIVLNGLHALVQLPLYRRKTAKLIVGIIALGLSAFMIWFTAHMGYALGKAGEVFGKQLVETRQIYVVVRAEDPAQELGDTVGYTYGYVKGWYAEDTASLLHQLEEQLGVTDPGEYDNPSSLLEALYHSETDAILLTDGAMEALEKMDEHEDVGERTRIIYTFTVTHKVDIALGGTEMSEPFVIYCNGIDSRSNDINASGNSDVNILAVVNPQTREILLLNTPRDYYVALHMNGEMDKLTHAGNYGIEESIGTLEDLYGVEIPYYIRINFFGTVDVVDAIGGVDVESPKEFTTVRMKVPGSDGKLEKKTFTFPEGKIHLNGQEALAFSRERKAFASGDNQRGVNQMTVIHAIIDKITSPDLLKNYQQVLDSLPNAVLTNITFDQVKYMVRAQQKDSTKWNVTSYAVTGSGDMDYCYSWSGMKLYVTRQDPVSVETAKTLIAQVLNGERPVLPGSDSK